MTEIKLSEKLLSRREVIRRALMFTGASTLVGSTALLNVACAPLLDRERAAVNSLFTAQQIAWLDEVAETILPETQTPGAKAAQTGAFIAVMVTDCYSPQEQVLFKQGMQTLETQCQRNYSTDFMSANSAQRTALLLQIDQERFNFMDGLTDEDTPHYFHTMKDLTVLGYFTSEIGYTQAMRYAESPGRFDPCVEYRPGDLIWARHA